MTLIIGVLCSDGIVMGADGAATLGALGQHTVVQPVKKLTKIADTAVMGVSGAVGLSQRIGGTIDGLWANNRLRGTSAEVMGIIREAIGPMLVTEMNYAKQAAQLIGTGAAAPAALSATLLAIPIQRTLRLYQFDCTGSPEEATRDLPFVTIGRGQNLADPFLAFLREIFWKNAEPTISAGVFATVWSLLHAIRTNTGGVAEPIQLMTIRLDGGRAAIREFDEAELAETRQAVADAEAHVGTFRNAPPQPPPVPPPTQ